MSHCEKGQITFDEEVLNYVQCSRETYDSILNDHLIKSRDHFGSLLHYAAVNDNTAVVKQLIALGSEVDSVGRDGCTPFMLAVERRCTATFAEIFLKAKASIDIVDDDGRSILQRAFGSFNCDSPLVKLFASKVKTKRTTPDALAKRLIAAGCKMYEAATLRDIEVMQCMLDYGIDVSISSFVKRTALHRAVEMNDLEMVNWLVQKGADVNAVDSFEMSALHVAARRGNRAILQILLERGADPNREDKILEYNALQMIVDRHGEDVNVEKSVKCVELLLQHGATFDLTPPYGRTVFDHVLDWSSDEAVKIFVSQLAVFKVLNSSMSEPFVFCNRKRHRSKQVELEELYQLCLQVLKTKLFEDLSLLDLLNASESRLNSLVRRKMFVPELNSIISEHKLSETHVFYYNTLMKRIEKAGRVVKLEDKAILVICKLFRCYYNQCYNFARKIVEYLKVYELEQLVQV